MIDTLVRRLRWVLTDPRAMHAVGMVDGILFAALVSAIL